MFWFNSHSCVSLNPAGRTPSCTSENTDPDLYKYEVTIDGVPSSGTIYGNSALYGFCNNGCVLKLIDNGQTIEMQPDDHIIIDNGELKRQNE